VRIVSSAAWARRALGGLIAPGQARRYSSYDAGRELAQPWVDWAAERRRPSSRVKSLVNLAAAQRWRRGDATLKK